MLRPLVAGHKCPTRHLSNFADVLLKSQIKSYVKGDFDFLKKCKRNLTKGLKQASLDVTSL